MLEVHTALKTLVEFYESAKKQNSKSSAILKHADTHTKLPTNSWLKKKAKIIVVENLQFIPAAQLNTPLH